MLQFRLFLGLLLEFLDKTDIGEIHLFKPPEIKEVYNNRNGNSQETDQEERVGKLHSSVSESRQK